MLCIIIVVIKLWIAVQWSGAAVGFTFHGCPTFNAGLATIRSNLEDTAKVIITIKGVVRKE